MASQTCRMCGEVFGTDDPYETSGYCSKLCEDRDCPGDGCDGCPGCRKESKDNDETA